MIETRTIRGILYHRLQLLTIHARPETKNQLLSSAMQFKLEAGNFRAAMRILCALTSPTERHHTSISYRQTSETSRRSTNTNLPDRQHKICTAADPSRRRQEDLTHLWGPQNRTANTLLPGKSAIFNFSSLSINGLLTLPSTEVPPVSRGVSPHQGGSLSITNTNGRCVIQ